MSEPINQSLLKHIGIIMDGNGRWAQKKLLPRMIGHQQGIKSLKKIVKHVGSLKIPYLSVFAFSTENWLRPQSEVSFLMQLLYDNLKQEVNILNQQNVKLQFIGNRDNLSDKLKELIITSEASTTNNSGLHLLIGLNYSGQYDITQAVNKLIAQKLSSNSNKHTITANDFSQQLLTANIPDLDLLIRTGGESRISNFMLWQVAYSELYFTNKLWPAFTPKELDKALAWFYTRNRKFGQLLP